MKRPELLTLAQNKEIDEMMTQLSQWYHEKSLTNTMSVPEMMEMMDEMNTLKEANGANFDKQFLTMMTSHLLSDRINGGFLTGKESGCVATNLKKRKRT